MSDSFSCDIVVAFNVGKPVFFTVCSMAWKTVSIHCHWHGHIFSSSGDLSPRRFRKWKLLLDKTGVFPTGVCPPQSPPAFLFSMPWLLTILAYWLCIKSLLLLDSGPRKKVCSLVVCLLGVLRRIKLGLHIR